MSGVGFLGGGVILRQGTSVTGINTAATIWCSAAVGTLAGAGYPLAATIGAVFVLTVHLALRPVARHIARLPAADETETIYRFRQLAGRAGRGDPREQHGAGGRRMSRRVPCPPGYWQDQILLPMAGSARRR